MYADRMRVDRHIVCLIAAMILAIVASALPSAAQAHAGHDHGVTVSARIAEPAPDVFLAVATQPGMAAAIASRGTQDADGQKRPGCDGSCCGRLACCVPCILPAQVTLPYRVARPVAVWPPDCAALRCVGPESLRKPPRTLA
ncbi:hypothetical protein ASF39_02825 [Methylobacterium sp. Leaf108]|nr:hypothetical protein ASF39_02825 [Methylobacterium sp. Leaf108]